MGSMNELVLRATKEIVVKFIETGRVGPAGFYETFKTVYTTVQEFATGSQHPLNKIPKKPTHDTF